MVNYSSIATRLAATLLTTRGEISIADIRALPLVDDNAVAASIADILARDFELERYQRRVTGLPSGVEDVLRLVTTDRMPAVVSVSS